MATSMPKRSIARAQLVRTVRSFATVSPVVGHNRNHKIVVVGGGSAGLCISHQLLRQGNFHQDDIAVIDPATWHHYQPGWTLVGAGLKTKESLRKPLKDLIDPKLRFYNTCVNGFSPDDNSLTLKNGDKVNYEQLVVAPGITVDVGSVKGLSEALDNPDSLVSSIYNYDHCDKVFGTIKKLQRGKAIFTQPTGVIKCAGAPQKIMWLALDHWKRAGLYDVKIPLLEELRKERSVEGLFQHDLTAIDGNVATFTRTDGQGQVKREFDLLHVAPKNRPHDFVKNSVLANDAGYVNVDEGTTRHVKYQNVWSAGDASSLPTSKTIAAITAEAPVLARNLLLAIDGKEPEEVYDGYTSCPLLTEYGKVLLAEFKYGGVPKETFNKWLGIDQAIPRREFYYLKKDFFPWVYGKYMVKGTWGGPKGWIR
ncbi:241cd328-9200-4f21-b565-b58667517c6d-CDS [Sclerotinia trifoliorum]|uniref:241cd328-9200-4f21-b565-b58667517c6d-CDS n=1 Tax=Sclerotinia trifoliorum TaxID=28548 RepID=A0A8H2W734_9HELO|nr:241cd328-9200-4f21-b565-b58667517c6d-CDS [Sclerotinia trifoliorum]